MTKLQIQDLNLKTQWLSPAPIRPAQFTIGALKSEKWDFPRFWRKIWLSVFGQKTSKMVNKKSRSAISYPSKSWKLMFLLLLDFAIFGFDLRFVGCRHVVQKDSVSRPIKKMVHTWTQTTHSDLQFLWIIVCLHSRDMSDMSFQFRHRFKRMYEKYVDYTWSYFITIYGLDRMIFLFTHYYIFWLVVSNFFYFP